ncbi:MAG: AI-2E family transporter [Deltaproteobacteria bacterium]
MAQMARLVSLLLMGTVIVMLALTFYQVIAPFLMPLFLAGVLAVLCQPLYRQNLKWTKGRTAVAAGATTAVVLTVILVPAAVGTVAAARQLYTLAQSTLSATNLKKGSDWAELAHRIQDSALVDGLIHRYEAWTGEAVDRDELQSEIRARLREGSLILARKTLGYAGSTLSLLGTVVSILIGGLTFVIAFYYFLADGPALIEATEKLIPVHRDYVRSLLVQFDQAVRAVVSATFAAALGQGIATGIGMQVAGFGHFFIVTILATLTALVPVLGTWLIWGPYVVWLAYHDHWVAATVLTLYGSIFVGLLDNAIRAYVLHSNVKLHPLLAFVSVLGGIQVMGLWGIFIGPIVASCLHALLKIFNTELVAFSEEKQGRAPSEAESVTPIAVSSDGAQPEPAPAVASSEATSPAATTPAPAAPPVAAAKPAAAGDATRK